MPLLTLAQAKAHGAGRYQHYDKYGVKSDCIAEIDHSGLCHWVHPYKTSWTDWPDHGYLWQCIERHSSNDTRLLLCDTPSSSSQDRSTSS